MTTRYDSTSRTWLATITVSPTGTHHLLDGLGVATLCGLDLSPRERIRWPVWKDSSWYSLPYRCRTCDKRAPV